MPYARFNVTLLRWVFGFKIGSTRPSGLLDLLGVPHQPATARRYYVVLYFGPLSMIVWCRGRIPQETEE